MAPLGPSVYTGSGYRDRLIGVTSFFLIMAVGLVSLRYYVRLRIVKNLGIDDWLLLPGLIFTITFYAFAFITVEHGLGRTVNQLDAHDLVAMVKYQAIARPIWVLSVTFIKLSIAVTILRITVKQSWRYVLYGLMISMSIWNLVMFFMFTFQCRPYSAMWRTDRKPSSCMSYQMAKNLAWVFSVGDIFYNLAFSLIPIPILWNVQLAPRVKASIMIILGLGLFASVAAMVRFSYVLKQTQNLDVSEEIGRIGPNVVLWVVVEIGLGIVATAIAALRPIIEKTFRKLSRATSASWSRRKQTSSSSELAQPVRLNYMGGRTEVSVGMKPATPESQGRSATPEIRREKSVIVETEEAV